MNKTQRLSCYAAALLLGAAWIAFSVDASRAAQTLSAPQVGFRAPDFALPALDGKTYTLAGLRGKAVLVNLWATWCPPCRAEMPALEKIYREYQARGLVVLAVNATYQDDRAAVAPFAQQYGLTFPIPLDETGVAGAAYQLRSLPSSYFINRDGFVAAVVIGALDEALLRVNVEAVLE